MSTYLRRYRLEPRRRTGRILAVALVLMALLFGKVWQSISANSLSIERDRLRREVRALENRIRLSSELRVQAALREGLDHNALQALGFQNPDPAAVVPIDLNQPLPRAKGARDGVAARFGSLLRGFGGGPGRERAGDEASALPVSAEITR
ncbi:MAG TPA: hypothetical protein VFT32_01740 [Candidatus Eisenbacteria bacterium]|nr:hypothetical protein [Candidatus Eisenbacteria bacterium]